MKKFDKLRVTLLGFLVCLMSMSLMAQRVTMDFTTNGWGLPTSYVKEAATYDNGTYQITFNPGTTGDGIKFDNQNHCLLFGKTNSSISLPAFDFNVERIEIVGRSGASGAVKQNIFVNGTAVSAETTGATGTNVYEIADAYQAAGNIYTIKVSSKHNTQITYIKVYEAASPAAVAAPTCTPAAGMFYAAQEVTLATTTVGATIYYSLDGSTPSLLYNDPIEISEATTLKAFAVLGEDTSAVTTAEYTFPVNAATIAELKANGVQNTIYKVAEDVVVIFQNGKYLFVQDNDNALVVYDNFQVVDTYNAGDVISGGFFGKYTVYNNMNELATVNDAPAFPAGVAGTPVEPTVATVSEVANNYLTWESKLVKFENVTFVDADHFTQGDDTMKVYNMFGTSCSLAAGYTANVTGLIGKFHDDVQILPRTNADVEVLSAPAAELPYRVDFDDNIDENLAINNGNYTNKWYIGKAQDFDNNKLYISSSIGRTNKYNNEAASEVTVSRNLVIPAKGAIVTFDCRYKGEANNDYLQFDVIGENQTISEVVNSTDNNWQNVTMSIPSDMAGIVTVKFTWKNDSRNGEQYPAAIDNIYIYESPCTQPTALQTSVDTTSATITWSGDAAAYLLQYKISTRGDDEWYSVNVNDTTLTLTDLQSNSDYNVKVQSVCEGFVSAAAEGSFTVDCQNWISHGGRDYKVVGDEAIAITEEYMPFYGYYTYAYSQQIINASEIGVAEGTTIYSVSFKCAEAPVQGSTGNIKIWLGNTSKTTFNNNSDYISTNSLTKVYDVSGNYNYQTGWNEFVFTTPFTYNGENLVIAYYEGNDSYSGNPHGSFYVNSIDGNKSIYQYDDDYYNVSYSNPASSGAYYKDVKPYRNVIKLNMDMPASCGDPILCPAVTDVTVSDITSEGATISWTPGAEDEASFIVEYQLAGDETWTLADANVTTTTYTLTGLAPMANYQVRVKANCGTYNVSESQLSEQFRTKGICAPVTEISHYNLATTAVLTWTPGADENAWTVKFKPTTADESAWVMIPVQGQATASLGGLQAQTAYDVQILALCEGDQTGLLSEWATYSFTSACASVEIPVTYTLKSDDHDCWEAEEFNFTSNYGATSSITNAFLISPSFTIPSEGQYYVSFDAEGSYKLLASYRGTREDRFEVLAEVNNTTGLQIFAIPESYLGRGVNFKIVNTAPMFNGLTITNFKVNACPFATTNLTVSNLTSNSATLSWTASELATNFQIQVNGDTFIDVEGATTYTLTDLQESTSYTVAVRSHCGEDVYGEWSNTINFTTPCAALELPYTEDFNDYEAVTGASAPSNYPNHTMPDCWSFLNMSTSTSSYPQMFLTSNSGYPVSGNCLFFKSSSTTPAYAVLPAFTTPIENIIVSFTYRNEGVGTSNGTLYLGYMSNPADASTFVPVYTCTQTTTKTDVEKTFANVGVTGTNYYIAFRYTGRSSNNYYASIDNVKVIAIPTCGVPTIAVDGTMATITPNEIGTPESYDLAIGEDTVTNVAGPTVDLTTIFTLAPNTEYAVSVKANCSEEDQSLWSDPVNFTTPCAALGLPYTEDFEDYQAATYYYYPGVMPDCWTSDWTATASSSTNDYSPKVCNYSSYKPGDGNYLYFMAGGSGYSYYQDPTVVILPEFNADLSQAMISFRARCNNSSYTTYGALYLGYVNAANEFTSLRTITCPTAANAPLQTIELNTYTIPEGSKLAFKADYTYSSTYSTFHVGIDDIRVELIPTCGVPTLTVNTSAVATITPNEIGAPESYDLMIGEDIVNVTATTTTTTVDLTTIFTLAPTTEYAVSVRANCGEGDQSLWSDPVSFTTPCMALSIPYTQDFEGTEFPPQCWTQEYVSGTHNWVRATSSSYGSGSYDAAFMHISSGSKTKLITPMFDLSSERSVKLIFKHRQVEWSGDIDFLEVYYRPSSSAAWVSLAQYNYAVANLTTETVILPAAALTATCQFAFEATDNYGRDVYVDDVIIDRAPTCITPTDLTVVSAADTTAQLAWTDQLHQPAYKVQYRLAGESTWQEVTGITETNCTLHNLQHSSNYEARVLADCGDGDESEASEIVSFTTICLGGYYEGVSIGEGTSTSSYLPSNINWRYSLTQQIYTAEEMDFTGDLNSVSFYNTSTSATRNLSVYLVHTEKTSFSGTSDWIMVSGSDKVFEGDVTFIQNDWTNIAFDRPFAYNGTSNVVLIVDDNTGSYPGSKSFRAYDAGSNRAFYAYSDNYNGNPTTGSDISSMSKYTGTSLNQVLFNGGRVLNCPPTCPNPTDLAAVNVTANAATITWTAGGSETAWNVEYGKAGFTPGEGTMLAVEEASVELTGLEMGFAYDVYVQANCAEDDQSEWAGPAKFVTECEAIATLPYTQDFEGETFEPACWSQEQLEGYDSWELFIEEDNNNNSCTKLSGDGYYANSADLITPTFNLSSYESVMITFDHVQWPYTLVDKLELLYRTSDNTDWTLIQEYTEQTGYWSAPRVWKNERVILPAEALVENVQFAFRGTGRNGDGNSIYLDNVVVMEVPDCYAPTALTLNDVTTTTAQISWTAGDDVQTAWNVQYGEHNFTLGEGTIISNLDTTAVELTALMSGTAYDVYVQAVCDEVSAWAGPVVLVTECVTINSLPYTQDFGGDFFEPICWSQEQVSGSHSWVLYGDNTGNVCVGFPDVTPYDANNSSADLITPIFNLSSYESVMMSFDHVQWPKKGVVDKLGLFYRTSEDVDWTLIKEYTEATGEYSNPLDWKNEKIILPEEVLTDNVQFAFRGTEMNGYYIYFDNVVLMETPCGHIEDLAVAQDSMTDTRAYITWNGVAEEYSLEYKEVNDETWTVVPVTGKAQWLTDLTPSTSYNVRVKAVCAEETQYSEVIDFETYCLGYYFDKYGAVQCPELHNDLTVNNLSVFRTACEIHAPVVVKVTNNAYLDSINSLNLYYVVNNGDTVAETLTMTTPLCYQNETTYTFNEIPVFEEGNNTVYAWVEYNGGIFVADRAVPARILNPIDEYPYYNTLKNVVAYDGWNAYDVNEDNVTMISNSNGLTYRYNDTLDANDWMITPCFYFEPGKYVISYSYNANSVLKESFEFWYGNGANVADMTTMLGSEEFSGTTVATSTFDFDVTEAGVYNFGFWATSLAGNLGFNITNFSIEPVNIVTITTDGNGTTTPSGEVYVNYNNNLTLNIVPNVNYHLSAIYVDSVQVMGEDPYASRFVMYTLENVTEPHDVFVEFKLEFHTHKIVSNYNPAYDQTEGGYFVPATSDTTIRVSDHTVFFAPNEHYHFNSLTLSEMDETDPVDFTDSVVYDETTGLYAFTFYNLTVPEYFVNAQFRRDTVNIHYTALTGQGYADDSPRMIAGDSVFGEYDTWVDYDIHGDLDTTITITPAGDYHIVNVYVNGQPQNVESDEFHYTFSNVTETQYVDVNFGYQVTASIRNYVPTYLGSDEVRGTIAPDTQLVAEGYPTVITGTVQEHFHLYNLFVDGVDMIDQVVFDGYNYSLTIDSTIANYNIEAVVKIDTMGIHYEVMDGQGYADASNLLVAPADYITWVNYGDDFMMNLTPDRGFSIGSVIVDGENMYTANNYLFNNVVEHHYVAVTFVPNDYTITTNAYGQGVVSEGMSFTYDPANPVNYVFAANAAEGYHISAVLVNDVEQDLTDITNVYTLPLNDVADNYVINAIFEINTYNMVSEASLGGTITPEGLQVVNHGTDLTYEIVADEGRYISSITIDGITVEYTQADNITNLPQQFTSINADHSISVTFAVKHFTITAEVNEEANHGTIDGVSSFSGEFSYGSNQTLNFIPEENYQVSDVVVDGQSVGAVASYEFVNITAEHNVVVSFAPVQYTLTATSNVPACTITPATTTVQAGSNVNYTMTVATGYHLLNVIANGEEVSVSGNAFTIANVQEDYEIFANFAPNYVTVTVEQPAHATITPGTMTYAYGATPSYVIVPEVGYNVTAVHAGNTLVNVTYNNGIGSFTLNPVTADVTLTATTAIKTFTITATQAAHGTISPVAVQTVNYGGNVTYTITPDDYYEIVDVLVDGASRGAISTYTFNNVTDNHTIEAVFEAVCMTPSRLTVVYVDTNSATLTWEGNADSYEVRYRAAGETNFTTQTVTTNTITLTGLTENTLYAWGVKANCTASMSSDWAESAFRTNAVIPPYVGISTADLSSIKVYSHLNNVYIVNENGIAIENVTIYNIFGAQVYTGKANNNPEIISLDVANGNYIVRLSTENGVGVYKLSIVR